MLKSVTQDAQNIVTSIAGLYQPQLKVSHGVCVSNTIWQDHYL